MADDKNAIRSWTVAAAALMFHTINGLFALLTSAFPATLDELQHLSFIRSMERRPQLLPRYGDLRVLDAAAAHFTATANYLNHPSPYYLLMGPIDRALGGSFMGLRSANLGLSLCALGLMLAGGFCVLKDWRERAVFAAVLVLFPKLGVVAGLINNDNLALVAAAAGFLALIKWQRRPTAATALFLATAVALCGWTKLTVLLMAGCSVVIGEGLRFWTSKRRPSRSACAIVAAGFLAAFVPSIANVAAYGRVLHHTLTFYVPPADRVPMSMGRYAIVFFHNMIDKWSATEPSGLPQRLGFCVVLVLAVAVVAIAKPQMRDSENDTDVGADWRTACAMILAAAPVMALHLYFGWRTFLEDGFIEMAQMRYYYGLWPGFALGLALLWRSTPPQTLRAGVTVVTASLLVSSSIAFAAIVLLIQGQARIG